MRRVAALLAALGAVVPLGACGGGDDASAPVRVERIAAGAGSTGGWVFRRSDLRGRRLPVVLFAHGWGAVDPRTYGAWIDHLAREGNEVIYPRYQDSVLEVPSRTLGNLVVGVRRAFSLPGAPIDQASLVAVGHSAGGALIADYSAASRALRLPVPLAIVPVYPGRAIGPHTPAAIPELPGSRIPAATRIEAFAGTHDTTVGSRWARRIVRTATHVPTARRRLRIVDGGAVAEHRGPLLVTPAAKRAFWGPLDRVIRQARGSG